MHHMDQYVFRAWPACANLLRDGKARTGAKCEQAYAPSMPVTRGSAAMPIPNAAASCGNALHMWDTAWMVLLYADSGQK